MGNLTNFIVVIHNCLAPANRYKLIPWISTAGELEGWNRFYGLGCVATVNFVFRFVAAYLRL